MGGMPINTKGCQYIGNRKTSVLGKGGRATNAKRGRLGRVGGGTNGDAEIPMIGKWAMHGKPGSDECEGEE